MRTCELGRRSLRDAPAAYVHGSSARLVTALQADHAPTRGRHAGSDSRSSDSSGRARGAPPWALPSSPLSCGQKRAVLCTGVLWALNFWMESMMTNWMVSPTTGIT